MRRPTLLLLLLASTTALSAPRPTDASMRKAFEANQQSVVKIEGVGKKPKSGPGVIVSREGHVITSVEYVSLESATLHLGAEQIPVDVVVADAKLKIAVVKPRAGEYRASAVQTDVKLANGDWLVAVGRKKDGGFDPKAGQILRLPTGATPFFETDIFLPSGTPLYDHKGRLVAVLVTNKGRALPIPVVKAKIAEAMKLSGSTAP